MSRRPPRPNTKAERATPDVLTFLTTWSFDPVALVVILAAAALYGLGIRAAARNGVRWGVGPTLAFFLLGLGSFAWVEFGFLGTWSVDLRWAFTTRVAFLLFIVPSLMTLGRPITLARAALNGPAAERLEAVLGSRAVRLTGNAVFAPLVAVAGFLVFLTPFAAALREAPGWEATVTLLVPAVGLAMVLPIAETGLMRTSLFITAEFLLAFVELLLDSIPGLMLRLNDAVLDHAPALTGSLPGWFPSALHDQHLSGDFLWFIAEFADIPVLIILFVRWMRTDRGEAKAMDELSDEEMERLTQEHLRGR